MWHTCIFIIFYFWNHMTCFHYFISYSLSDFPFDYLSSCTMYLTICYVTDFVKTFLIFLKLCNCFKIVYTKDFPLSFVWYHFVSIVISYKHTFCLSVILYIHLFKNVICWKKYQLNSASYGDCLFNDRSIF